MRARPAAMKGAISQAFDQYAIQSLLNDVNHIEIGAGFYANPHNRGTAVNLLDAVVLGATEIDVHFNVNVNTHSDGLLQYATGGHADTAAGAKLTIITTPLIRGRIPVSWTMWSWCPLPVNRWTSW